MAINKIELENETWFRIANHDLMRPFLMSVVSDANHWMFISSNGGLTAGRKNAQYALFPYYTDDKLSDMAGTTGSKTIVRVSETGHAQVWEPFSERFADQYRISRNLYKNIRGNKVLFEEINHDLGLTFRYQWNSSDRFGFIRKASIANTSAFDYSIELLDGLQNIMPYGIPSDLQMTTSNLADAYKRSELVAETGLGIFALSAIIVDKAEPSEALKANIAWSLGLEKSSYLLSSRQLEPFRKGRPIEAERDVKGEKGAYFVHAAFSLPANSGKDWMIIADVNQNHGQIVRLNRQIKDDAGLSLQIRDDIEQGSRRLQQLLAAADGLQKTADLLKDARHYSNVLFNILRGGIFDQGYQIEKKDFLRYLSGASKAVAERYQDSLMGLGDNFDKQQLDAALANIDDPDLIRICTEYLPLKLSRRHGDPSRPWNQFSINIKNELDGSRILDYEGNWRDIFQNWEALAQAYPGFLEGMISKFLNASTFDGYNPYRITKGGFDWETIEPDNPWSYIGYWGDHQIIYLLKLLESFERFYPGALPGLLDRANFVYAHVPYQIKPYREIVKDPKNTIDFDEASDHAIRAGMAEKGADGALLGSNASDIHRVNFMEKVLATVLAKLSNFIPEGGIWMNTQRPEWNDANNALVGNGVSMVTLYYLRRFLKFFEKVIAQAEQEQLLVSQELHDFFTRIAQVLQQSLHLLPGKIDDGSRRSIAEALGQAGSDYRGGIYDKGFSGQKKPLSIANISGLIQAALAHLEHAIDVNKRPDDLYHTYNLLTISEHGMSLSHLDEMLEGQVAVLSSGYLSAEAALKLLDALKNSALYREDQNSYLLYPNKALPGFLQKNHIPKALAEQSRLLRQLLLDQDFRIINQDVEGAYHFNGNFRNAGDLKTALEALRSTSYGPLVEEEEEAVLAIFEQVFNHKAFTGRSGTFFAYEGLGSIYWHMVSKLHLAVQEVCIHAIEAKAGADVVGKLKAHYYDIGEGIGVHKSPELYGAFPTDPYSHTPLHKGAQQPGMTGQVKEDILVRIGEMGVFVHDGKLGFNPCLLKSTEFLSEAATFEYFDIHDELQRLESGPGSLCFTCCQVPVVYQLGAEEGVETVFLNGAVKRSDALELDAGISSSIFQRTGEVKKITVFIRRTSLS